MPCKYILFCHYAHLCEENIRKMRKKAVSISDEGLHRYMAEILPTIQSINHSKEIYTWCKNEYDTVVIF